MLRTLLVCVFLSFYILLLGPLFILHCLITRRPDPLYFVGVAGAKLALRLAGIRVRAEGLENIPAAVCIFVGNHSSNVDPPAVVAAIPRRVALMAKKEVFRIPIQSTAFRLVNFVPVDRSSRAGALESAEKAIGFLRAGISFLIFPEGTRSPDGRLRPFKKGPFVMAIRAGVPIVPVSVAGAHHIMRKHGLALHPGEIFVRFCPPVDAATYTVDRKAELIARVHAAVASALPEDQQPLRDSPSTPAEDES